MCGQRTRVRRCNQAVAWSRLTVPLARHGHEEFGLDAPENPNEGVSPFHEVQQHRLNQRLPPQLLMGTCDPELRGERSIEQHQDSLRSPVRQIHRSVGSQSQITRAFLEHVSQGGRHGLGRGSDTECQSMGLAGTVIWVLSQHHHANTLRTCQLKSSPNLRQWRTQRPRHLSFVDHIEKLLGNDATTVNLGPPRHQRLPCRGGGRPKNISCAHRVFA